MESIKIQKSIDIADKMDMFDEEIKSLGFSDYEECELKFCPICKDILVLVFECRINREEKPDIYEYRVLMYDLLKHEILEKEYSISMSGKMLSKVLEIDEEGILLDIWDYEEDLNFVCHTKDMNTLIALGFGPSMCASIPGKDRIVAGYGYAAVRDNNEAPIKIYDKKNGTVVWQYINSKALGCVDFYVDEKNVIWATFWGDNRIVKIDGEEVSEYDCEMSGFGGIVMVKDAKTLYVNFEYDEEYDDRIFKMDLEEGKFKNAREVKLYDTWGNEMFLGRMSSECGHVVGRCRYTKVGILDI